MLGVFWLRPWARLEELKALTGGKKAESERWLEGFEQAVELGRACPRTRMITVCDRKGDIFSLLRRQAAQTDAAGLLLSSDGEATAQDALRTVARYERRWLIDEYLEVLKCGTKLPDRRLREAASIENCLARERPAAPVGESFSSVEVEVPNELLNAEEILPPALREAAAAGGHPHDGGESGPRDRLRALQAPVAAGRRDRVEGVAGDQANGSLGGGSRRASRESAHDWVNCAPVTDRTRHWQARTNALPRAVGAI